jgi:hypothetical protein
VCYILRNELEFHSVKKDNPIHLIFPPKPHAHTSVIYQSTHPPIQVIFFEPQLPIKCPCRPTMQPDLPSILLVGIAGLSGQRTELPRGGGKSHVA